MKFVRNAAALALASAATVALSMFAVAPAQADTGWGTIVAPVEGASDSGGDTGWGVNGTPQVLKVDTGWGV